MILLKGGPVREIASLRLIQEIHQGGRKPLLVIVQVGDDQRSSAYIRQKVLFGEKIGAVVSVVSLPATATQAEIVSKIVVLNQDSAVNGIIVQIPLPENLDRQAIIDAIDPQKDVDGLTSENQKLLRQGVPKIVPATARGILELLEHYQISVVGKGVVVMGRSKLVGMPTAKLLELRGAKVSVVHSGTENPKAITTKAEILVVAIGKAELVGPDYLSAGQVVVDVGINLASGECLDEEVGRKKLVGDVDFKAVEHLLKAISPVPGGVGPMTVLALFENLLDVSKMQNFSRQV